MSKAKIKQLFQN